MKLLLSTALAALVFAVPAYANGNHEQNSHGEHEGSSESSSHTESEVGSYSDVHFESDDDTTIITVNPVGLSNLPAANCQGVSSTASAGGGTGVFGLSIGGGHSEVDEQCTLRENIKLIGSITGGRGVMQIHMLKAMSQLEGFESMEEMFVPDEEDPEQTSDLPVEPASWVVSGRDK